MRLLLAFPLLAIVLAAYLALGLSGSMMQPQSELTSVQLPSGAIVYFNVSDVFLIAGLVALFFEMLKAGRAGAGTVVDHMLSTATFIVALLCFLLVEVSGTASFFLLTVMSLIDVVAGFSVSIFASRRDYSVTRGDGL